MISTLVSEAGSLTDLEAHQLTRLASQQALESVFLCLLGAGITDMLHSGFYMGPQGSNSGPQACVASTLWPNHLPSTCSWSRDHASHCPLETITMEKDFPAPSVLYETQEGWEGSQGHVARILQSLKGLRTCKEGTRDKKNVSVI